MVCVLCLEYVYVGIYCTYYLVCLVHRWFAVWRAFALLLYVDYVGLVVRLMCLVWFGFESGCLGCLLRGLFWRCLLWGFFCLLLRLALYFVGALIM